MIKAIFFDFDGVIAESMDVKTRAFAKLFEEFGPVVVEKVVAHHVANGGVSRFEKIRIYHEQFVGKPITEDELDSWCTRFSDLVLEAVVASSFVPGALDLLEKYCRKYSCFVVSGTPQEEMEIIVGRRGLEKYFIEIHGSPRKKIEIAREIMISHGLAPEEIIFIGDAMADYEAAKAAGIKFIGRVPEGNPNIFPPDARVVPDLTELSFD